MIKRVYRYLFLLVSFFCLVQWANAQTNNELKTPTNGVADKSIRTTAYIHANIQVSPDQLIEDGILVVKGNKIVAVGKSVTIPEDALEIDLKGKYVFASFIDLNSHYGISEAKPKKRPERPVFEGKMSHKSSWNDAIHPESNASDLFRIQNETAEKLRSAGFGVVLTHQQNGIARGSSVLVDLGEDRPLINSKASMHYSFNKGNSTQAYPSSMMGSIALLRQLFSDLDWYRFHHMEPDLSLEAMKANHRLPMFFESRDYQENVRAQKLAKETGRSFIIIGSGDSWKDADGLVAYNSRLVVPIKPKKAIELKDGYDISNVSLSQLQNWKYSKWNCYQLQQKGIPLSITYTGHRSGKDFFKSLRSTVQYGCDRNRIIAALTTVPASWMKVGDKYGKLEASYMANFFISDKDVFTDDAVIMQHVISGKTYGVHNLDLPDLRGKHKLIADGDTFTVKISGSLVSQKANVTLKGAKKKSKLELNENALKLSIDNAFFYSENDLNADEINGYFTKGDKKGSWSMSLKRKDEDFPSLNKKEAPASPQTAFAYRQGKKDVLIKNCTVWTCDENGVVPNLDVLVRNGKIADMGENLSAEGVEIVDGTGLHLTPGLVDEHSHIAIKRGVNEGTQAVTAEVRIEDVVNADDINIYRQAAGGTTTSHLLHGSANPIGGQTALVKLKYGKQYRDLIFDNDHRFIKFALGENVKQSNWGDRQVTRYPQTRMGVEQVFVDAFQRAQKYSELRSQDKIAPDWELEALSEIIQSKRFITCHSYQQGEINMLMHVADSFGFTVNTFTHILEGYKVADKMKDHGVAASTFSDWWAYKFEVNDAVPFNAALLNETGVLTGINSDDAEMGRRLNQEAAKAVKYGGASEVDALKMVTINPAKMLHIDDKVGSITPGKDADLVLWTDHPLSNYARVQTTWIDGEVYFDRELDAKERARVNEEKQKLIDEMTNSKDEKSSFKPEKHPHYHCDSMEVE